MNHKKLAGYLHAKKQHAKSHDDVAMYQELIDTLKQFPSRIAETIALIKLISA